MRNSKIKNNKNIKTIIEILKNPLLRLKEIAASEKNTKYLKTAILLIIIWTILVFINSTYKTIYYWGFEKIFVNIIGVLKVVLAPIIGTIIYTIILKLKNKKNKNNKKSIVTIFTVVTIIKLPLIIASGVSLLNMISKNMQIITNPFTILCQMITVILSYFGIKYLFKNEEDDDIYIKEFISIQIIYYIAYIFMSLFGIFI